VKTQRPFRPPARGARTTIAVVTACLLVTAACGSRLPTAQHVSAHGDWSDQLADDPTATDRRAGVGSVPGSGEAPTAGAVASAGAERADGTSTGHEADAAGGASDPGRGVRSPNGAGDTTPIVIGSVGNYSGVPGAAQVPGVRAVQVWVNSVNHRGGVAGHPIELIVVDDGGDPARHRAAVQDLVENRGVIAFVGQFASQTSDAARSFLEERRIPVIGGTGETFHNSPLFFPDFPSTPDVAFGAMRDGRRFTGKTKLATLTCVESATCSQYKSATRQFAAEVGIEIVYQADISVAQPDYTAECLRANAAGAELLLPVGDANTVRRVMESCARQGSSATLLNTLPHANQEGVDLFEGSVAANKAFPFMGVPGNQTTDAYLAAFEQFAPDEPLNTVTAGGWASAKIFEKAVVDGIGTGAPSSDKLLEALWTFDGETLGGLTVPLRFGRGNNPTTDNCWFSMVLTSGRWTTPDGLEPGCR
jgi:branched-chain amino acid transport system substrate-binding protein